MQFKTSTLIWLFIWCIFMGVTVGSIGIGAVFPAANVITKPFVCANGQFQLITQDYHPSPVETVTTLTWYCIDNTTGAREEISIYRMAFIAGPIYGLLLFLVIYTWMVYRARSLPSGTEPAGLTELMARQSQPQSSAAPGDMGGRDEELDELLRMEKEQAGQLRERLQARRGTNAMSATQGGKGTADQRLAELKRLHDSGLITDQDYAQKKANILGDL